MYVWVWGYLRGWVCVGWGIWWWVVRGGGGVGYCGLWILLYVYLYIAIIILFLYLLLFAIRAFIILELSFYQSVNTFSLCDVRTDSMLQLSASLKTLETYLKIILWVKTIHYPNKNNIPLGHNYTHGVVYSKMNFKIEICFAL